MAVQKVVRFIKMDEVESELKKKGITITGKLNPTGYKIVVPFSGGKDSQTCLTLALQHNKLRASNNI